MLTYPSKLLVSSRGEGFLRYACFDRSTGLTLTEADSIATSSAQSALSRIAAGALVLYVLSLDEYYSKQIEFASRFRLDTDPEQICWEIERRSVTPFHKFRYNLLPLKGTDQSGSLITFAVSDLGQQEIGEYFHFAHLVLHRLVFKPVALHSALRSQVGTGQCVAAIIADKQCDLLFYHSQKLVAARSLKCDLSDSNPLSRFVDDLGTLSASIFSGVRLNQTLELLVAGVPDQHQVIERIARQLPYRLEIRHCSIEDIGQPMEDESTTKYETFYDLAVIARTFVESEPCESLPVKNAATP